VQEIIENFIVSATERELDVTVLGLDANHEDLRAFVDSSSADTTHPSARGAACNAHSEP
jgi:hypothetical protein